MNGKELDKCFGRFIHSVKAIQGFNNAVLNSVPFPVADPTCDVTEQQHTAKCSFVNGTLTISADPAGDGLWIPYLGNGRMTGVDGTGAKGWGTFTRGVTNHSWVATGPFSGCFVAAFDSLTGKRFAHLITPADGFACATVPQQIAAITAQTGANNVPTWSMNGNGVGIAFFMNHSGRWHLRRVWVVPGAGTVVQIDSSSTSI